MHIPVIGDGDTGHGNAANLQRTVVQYSRAGCAGIMLEDQRSPKRCGHTGVRAALARSLGDQAALEEAIWRLEAFADLGADGLFLEAPHNEAEMGYRIAADPLTLIASAVLAMQTALDDLACGRKPDQPTSFSSLRTLLGFDAYEDRLQRYNGKSDQPGT